MTMDLICPGQARPALAVFLLCPKLSFSLPIIRTTKAPMVMHSSVQNSLHHHHKLLLVSLQEGFVAEDGVEAFLSAHMVSPGRYLRELDHSNAGKIIC